MMSAPNYLSDYAELHATNPHAANLAWFADAKWGLFLHYGLYSQLRRGEWVLRNEKIPLAEYEKLFDRFAPENFDADHITDQALAAEMKYINLTACHHEGFCLWNSSTEAFNSYTACKRDLVMELAEACDRKGLGFFAYYTHILHWRHPHAMIGEGLEMCRVEYEHAEPRYEITDPKDNPKFWEYAHACIKELCELKAPLAGVWLDLIMAYYKASGHIPIEETYRLIREARPEALISFKQGATGTEDFAAPEHTANGMAHLLRDMGNEKGARIAEEAWNANKDKHNEICTTLQGTGWGVKDDTEHLDADEVWGRLAYALSQNCNLLINTGPNADGSIPECDAQALRTVGERIRREGWPTPAHAIEPESWSKKKSGAQAI
ncbi:MAG: alpha-L-fucosidase [Planctomycetota bacterium]|jgi:alpha-L-fucosidase